MDFASISAMRICSWPTEMSSVRTAITLVTPFSKAQSTAKGSRAKNKGAVSNPNHIYVGQKLAL